MNWTSQTADLEVPVGEQAYAESIDSTPVVRFAYLETILAWITEVPAAILVVAEILVLLTGVASRYLLNSPLTWVDELASTLFLWLSMLGSVIALRRGEHMRLTVIVNRSSPATRIWLETISTVMVVAFLLLILGPTLEHYELQSFITTPALEISDGYRAASIGTGCLLMLIVSVARLVEHTSLRHAVAAVILTVVIFAILLAAKPALLSMGNYNLFVFFVCIVGFAVATGVPIAFAFGLATVAYLQVMTTTPLGVVVGRMDEGMSHMVLLSVPLFVFLGVLIEMTGLARALVDFLASLLGHFRGGLNYVLLGAMFLVSGISGSKAADMAAVGPALLPEMRKRGSDPGEQVALLSAAGAMTETIPPSLVLITIGSVTGVSIAALFTGGILPAIVCTIAMGTICFLRSRNDSLDAGSKKSGKHIARAFVVALPAIILPIIIRTAVVEGVATATEVSTVGVAYTVLIGLLFYRQGSWKRTYQMLVETAALSGAILLIIGMATAMAWALTQSGFSKSLAEMMMAMPGGSFGFMAISIVTFILLGSLLEGIPAIVLFGPLLFPIARQLGIHDVHYAMVVILSMGLGLFAPPFGVGFYAACAVGRTSPDSAMRKVWPYLGALFIALLVVAAVPWLSTGML